MSKCLVTKLKSSISDNSLAKLGALRVTLAPNYDAISYYLKGEGCVLSVVSGSLTLTSVNTSDVLSLPYAFDPMEGYVDIKVGSEGAVVEISNKYNLKYLNGITDGANPGVDIKELVYSHELLELYRVGGDMSVIKDNLKKLKLVDVSSKGATGKLSDFGACTNITKLVTVPSSIGGSIEDFVRAQRNNGRTSCDKIEMGWANPNITFNGVSIGSAQINKNLSWTATTITYDEVTIDA